MPSALNYLIVHGCYGYPTENWFSWLQQQLEDDGGKVKVPQFPTPESQSFASWSRIAKCALSGWNPAETILIGHSVGSVFVLRLAEQATEPYKAVFAACPFAKPLGIPEFDPILPTFLEPPFDWARVKKGTQKIACFAGDNDPYVPLPYAREVADAVGAPLTVVEKGGHLNAAAGYTSFPAMFDAIRKASQ